MSDPSIQKGTLTLQGDVEDLLRGKKIAFLVGAPRSGTTWLQLLLARSPSVVTAQETHVFSAFLASAVYRWNEDRKTGAKTGVTLVLDDDEYHGLLRQASGLVLAKIAASKPTATVIMDKSPSHVRCSREILDAWPDAYFIHLIRDPRSVVASLRVASKTWAASWASKRISTNSETWISDVREGRAIPLATPNYLEVKYEDLIADGPQTLLRIFVALGVPASLDDCRQYIEECNIQNLKAGKLEGAPFNVAKMGKESWRIGTADSWRSELSKVEIAQIERLAGPLMQETGYKPAITSKAISIAAALALKSERAGKTVKQHLRRVLSL